MTSEFKIITGSESNCEKKLNDLNKKNWLTIHSMASIKDGITILVDVGAERDVAEEAP